MVKKILNSVGKFFIVLTKTNEQEIRQTVLLVDGSFILPNNFTLIIKGVREKFKNANITVLTFREKEGFIKDNFQDIEVITSGNGVIRKYQLAIKLFSLLRRKYAFIVLSSLDVSLLLVTMLFARQAVFLHNRWFEWYRIRYRTFLDVFLRTKSVDKNHRKINHGFSDRLKSLGRFFIILSQVQEENISQSVLVIDDGQGEIGYISTAVRKALVNFINPNMSVLTFIGRKHYFTGLFPGIKVFTVKDSNTEYGLAMQMYRMRKSMFSHIVLTNLDILPIFVSFLFMHGNTLLYNKWHEWWSLFFRSLYGYIKGVFVFIYSVFIFIYLLIVSGYILLRIGVRSLWIGLTQNLH